jgi:plastocyanin
MNRSLLTLLVVGAGATALAGCSSDDSGSSTSASGADTTSSQPATSADGTVQVTMKGIAYNPKTVAVRPGQRITWTNDDDVLHDVVSTSGERIESELFPKGKTFSFTPTRAGTIQYVCTIHPGMEGTIEVR